MNNRIKKVIAVSLVCVSMSLITCVSANAEWKRDSISWKFRYSDNSSYVTGWQMIDGKWYDFDGDGNMIVSSIVDNGKYFIDQNGDYSKPKEEMLEYSKIIKNYTNSKNLFCYNTVMDIDQDGIYEMLLDNGTCEATRNVIVYKYINGEMHSIKINGTGHGGYGGYNKDSKEFILIGGHMGYVWYRTYTLKNNTLTQVDEMSGSTDENTYELNGKSISKDELNNKLAQKFNIINYIGSF